MITLKELSERCGVSIATISNVINGKNNVSEATKKLVLDAVKETGYQPNYLASSLRSSKSRTIGIIIEDVTAFSSPAVIEGIMHSLERAGYRTFLENLRCYSKEIFDTGDKFREVVDQAIRQMLAIKVDGMIFLAAHSRVVDVFPDDLAVPAVVAYAKSLNQRLPSVIMNDELASYEITKYMISKGGKKFGMISGMSDSVHTIRRKSGYKKALEEAGFEFKEENIFSGKWFRETGYQYAPELIKKGIDSIVCGNDHIACGVCDYLRENGLVPGKDIHVSGFDGQEFADYVSPKLTTMKIPLWQIGNRAGQLIVSVINGEEIKETEITENCFFVEGATV